jgi:hypothetical protein
LEIEDGSSDVDEFVVAGISLTVFVGVVLVVGYAGARVERVDESITIGVVARVAHAVPSRSILVIS